MEIEKGKNMIHIKKLMIMIAMLIISAESLFALSVFGPVKNKEKVYVMNMYGQDISLEFIWRANSSLGGFDRTKEKILKKHHTTYQEFKAPFSEYHLYQIDVAPAKNAAQGPEQMNNQFDTYVTRQLNNDILQVERKDHYFIIEKSDEESGIPGQAKIVIREFISQAAADEYLKTAKTKQEAYLKNMKSQQEAQKHVKQAQQHLHALNPDFLKYYYGDSLNNNDDDVNMMQRNQMMLDNNFDNMQYAVSTN